MNARALTKSWREAGDQESSGSTPRAHPLKDSKPCRAEGTLPGRGLRREALVYVPTSRIMRFADRHLRLVGGSPLLACRQRPAERKVARLAQLT